MRRFRKGCAVKLKLQRWAAALNRDVIALWIAARDRRTPLLAKIVATMTAAYAFSPIDLIPDFIPVLGLLDDLLLVPAGIWLVIRLIPPALFAKFRLRAAAVARRPGKAGFAAMLPVLLTWAGLVAASAVLLWR